MYRFWKFGLSKNAKKNLILAREIQQWKNNIILLPVDSCCRVNKNLKIKKILYIKKIYIANSAWKRRNPNVVTCWQLLQGIFWQDSPVYPSQQSQRTLDNKMYFIKKEQGRIVHRSGIQLFIRNSLKRIKSIMGKSWYFLIYREN